MGAWGGLCCFDHIAFRAQVPPAFAAGEVHPLILQTLARVRLAAPRRRVPAFQGLAQLAPHYDVEMTSCAIGRVFSVCDGVLMLPQQPARCADRWGYEELADLFEWVVTRSALSQPTVLGLRFTSLAQLFPPELSPDPLAHELLALLDGRSRYWAHGTGGYGEGIQGWLDNQEAALLADCLAPIAEVLLLEHWSGDQNAATEHGARVGQFLAALQQAVAREHGLLWGRDLRIFYDDGRWLLSDGGEGGPA
jgi:hypothetical protein